MTRKKRGENQPQGRRRQVRRTADVPDSDYLLDAAYAHWHYILMMYRRFEDKRPVMLFDIQEQRIYAYPYAEFCKDLSERSQQALKEQYEEAVRDNQIVVFVRDNERRRLVSFSLDNE
jgi:hypothetical protein